ncbi:MAG: response regulator [Chloroflexia bacterium]|jgi:AmiR/NasT family two-component response regulator
MAATGTRAGTRVVIADDDPIIRMDLREMLTDLNYQVVGEAADGRNVVALARDLRPELVIMDIRMPEMDGIEAARVLTQETIAPVLLLTAYSEPELVQRATQAGVVGYLVKPFREAQLGPAIEVTLGRFREFQQLQKELGDLKEALEARKVIDRAKGFLMDRFNLSEADAFRRIQKRSMDTRKTMREVAEAIMLASEMEKEG